MTDTPLSDDELRAHVHQLLQTEPLVPEGKKGAIVSVVNLTQVSLVAAVKVPHGWEVSIIGTQEWRGDRKLEATIAKVW